MAMKRNLASFFALRGSSELTPAVNGDETLGWQMRSMFRVDGLLLVLIAAWLLLWATTVNRAVDNPRLLASFVNDEPLITMQLLGMIKAPYGNPANYMEHPDGRPSAWNGLPRYSGVYYGGLYLAISFFIWGPLSLLGLPDFPTAPLVLRCVSVASAALALVVLYNLCRRLSGFWVALVVVGYTATEPNLNYYASIIHPDTLQYLVALAGLWIAIYHAQKGDWRSLAALGILVGLVQGTKMGGVWLVPAAVLAVFWGLEDKSAGRPAASPFWSQFGIRLLALGVLSFAAWFVSTPYAFIDPFFFRQWIAASKAYQVAASGTVGLKEWCHELWQRQGALVTIGGVMGAVFHLIRVFRGYAESRPFVLAGIFAATIFLWTATTVKVWVTSAYIFPVFTISAFLTADLFWRVIQFLGTQWRPLGWVASCIAAALVWNILSVRGYDTLINAVTVHLQTLTHSTVGVIGQWGLENLPNGSRIMVDDVAYFDPDLFPDFTMHGGLMTYRALEDYHPDYLVLSSSLYDSAWVRELRMTETGVNPNNRDLDVRLYQDLLDKGGIPWIQPIRIFTGSSLPSGIIPLIKLLWNARDVVVGPELRLYRISRPSFDGRARTQRRSSQTPWMDPVTGTSS